MNEADVIKGARGILSDPKRWSQNGAGDDTDDTYCVLSAMAVSAGQNREAFWDYHKDTPLNRARVLVEAHLPEGFRSAWFYNDEPARTHEDILNLLDKTLAELGGLA
jgi:hypothetical protein